MSSNRNSGLLRSEFKHRYLAEFSTYVGGLMEESSGHSANFLFLFLTFLVGPLSLPVAGLLGIGVSARYAQVQKDVKVALAEASAEARQEMSLDSRSSRLSQVERWLDAHEDDLPGYLDRLDRYEEDRLRVRKLIESCNRQGSAAALSSEERALLKRHGVRKLRPPLYASYKLPPRCQLGNWHFSQLDRALWRDISKIAGARGKMIGRILGLART
jgi:hypothetical protein